MENSTILKDPVCGMTVTAKSFHQLQQNGQTYYFCGALCKARFTAPTQSLWGRLFGHLVRPHREALQGVGAKGTD